MEKVANEMDPDLVLIRLGSAIDKSQLTDKSAPISNVKDQDTFSVSFHRTNFEKKREAQAFSKLSGGTKTQYFENLDQNIQQAQEKFDEKFKKIFLSAKKDNDKNDDADFIQFQKEALSNLLGNIGHQYGKVKYQVQGMSRNWIPIDSRKPYELLASFPSRSRFARGFLWDEGFHLLMICKWNESLCIEIIQSWFDTMGEQNKGEIMFEQARSAETKALIPEEDLAIKVGTLQAPSIFMPIVSLLGKKNKSAQLQVLLAEIYPKFSQLFAFYEKRTLGTSIPCTFSYRDRTSILSESSCLDDYPRAVNFHDRAEVHLDLQSWMIDFALTMERFSKIMPGNQKKAEGFRELATCYAIKIEDYLLNENMGRYSDYVSL